MLNSQFNFWYRWLLVVSVISIFVGLVIALFPGSFLFTAHTNAIADVFFDGVIPSESMNFRSFLFGIIGGTIAGYFLLQTLIVWFPFYRKERWAWHAIFWAILLWFVTDSTLSLLHGAFFNVWMINIPALLATMIPLIMTKKEFKYLLITDMIARGATKKGTDVPSLRDTSHHTITLQLVTTFTFFVQNIESEFFLFWAMS